MYRSDTMETLPIAPIGRILSNAGAPRATKDAKIELSEKLTDLGEEIAKEAVEIAKHSGRKTVKASDVELAVKLKF
ncbi:histone family protein [Candidatus Methanosphaera massiliense]|uniref:histone family protein n=1 Tax=Methanosphaera TaxID=2316 RepID=UPI00237FFA7A|nr:histone family protein [Candidatus Methanosphaera massiliense]MDD6286483.1 histone family protein [Methanobacteriaceae archaeon]MDE4078878.1 histone family protein [Candidatus Methanosphaera massiliense]